MSAATFAELTPRDRVEVIEHICGHLLNPAIGLEPPTLAWLDRMRHAMVDDAVAPEQYEELEGLWFAHLDELPEAQKSSAAGRLTTFALVLERMPGDARRPADWFRANSLEEFLRTMLEMAGFDTSNPAELRALLEAVGEEGAS
jgi:hypothetical protein